MKDDPDRIEAPDLVALLRPDDSGKWIALAPDYSAVWARAESFEALREKLTPEELAQKPSYYLVPALDAYYIPYVPPLPCGISTR